MLSLKSITALLKCLYKLILSYFLYRYSFRIIHKRFFVDIYKNIFKSELKPLISLYNGHIFY